MKSASSLFKRKKESFVLVNSLSYHFEGIVVIPNNYEGFTVTSNEGDTYLTQESDGQIIINVSLKPLSFTTFVKAEKVKDVRSIQSELILENHLVKYEFNNNGTLKVAYDKELNLNLIKNSGNVISLYEDRPLNWDAWDIDFYYKDSLIDTATVKNITKVVNGNVCSILNISYLIGNSKINQKITLGNDSKRLDFDTYVDWSEKHKMLRVHFPTSIKSEQASYDIQYGYVKRNTHKNTSWDRAKFEVVGHKYADLSNNDYGVALMNDCKYGYAILDNTIDLNLLRSPNNPDADADLGKHNFVYSFYPHKGDLIRSNVIKESTLLNHAPLLFDEYENISSKSPIDFIGEGIEIAAIKKSEFKNEFIIRAVETLGRYSKGDILFRGDLIETNLMEQKNIGVKKNVEGSFKIKLKPFEIKTFRLKKK